MSYLTHVSLIVGLVLVASPALAEDRSAERPSVSREEPRKPAPLERRLPRRATEDETKARQEPGTPDARSGLSNRRGLGVTRTPARPESVGAAPSGTSGARGVFDRTRTEADDQRVEKQRGTLRNSGERRPGERVPADRRGLDRSPATSTSSDRRDAASDRSPWAAERLERVGAPKARTPGVAIPQRQDGSAARLPDDSNDAWAGKDSGLAMPEQKGLGLDPSLSGASSDSGIGKSSAGIGPGGVLPGSSNDSGTTGIGPTRASTDTGLAGPDSTSGPGGFGTSPDVGMDLGALDTRGPSTPRDSTSAGTDGGSAPDLGDRNSTSGADPRLADDDSKGTSVKQWIINKVVGGGPDKGGGRDGGAPRGREVEGGDIGGTWEQVQAKVGSQNGGAGGTTNPTGATPVVSQEEAAELLRSQTGTQDVLIQTQEGAIEGGGVLEGGGQLGGAQPGAVNPSKPE